jgi:hypothetical protein
MHFRADGNDGSFAAPILGLQNRFFERIFIPGIDDGSCVAPGDTAICADFDFGGGIRCAASKYDNVQGNNLLFYKRRDGFRRPII